MFSKVLIKNNCGKFIDFKENLLIPAHKTEFFWNLPSEIGEGGFKKYVLNSGIEISLSNCKFKKDYQAKIEHDKPKITFAFNILGSTITKNSCLNKDFYSDKNQSYIHFFEDPLIERESKKQDVLKGLAIRISPQEFKKICGNQEEYDFFYGSSLKENNFLSSAKTTPLINSVLFQIFNCSHKNYVKQIFLESKALELIAYTLEELSYPKHGMQKISKKDKDIIFAARDMLIKDIKYPPSILTMASNLNISHTKLQRGFKNFFNCTVFEYLRKTRLEYGKYLLEKGKMTITETAFEAGFSSSSHFAACFYKYYGVKPSQYKN